MQQSPQHASPFKNWKQLVVLVALAFIVPVVVFILITQWVTSGKEGMNEDKSAVLARIAPVGHVVVAAPAAAKGELAGEQVYGQTCTACHQSGVLGAPKFGDKASWSKVIASGQAKAVEHAIKGVRAMPPKGGNADLENVEVERAVVFMANKAGAGWKEPAAPAPAAAAPVAAAPAPAVAAAAPAPAAAKVDGKKVYDTTCSVCHGAGIAGAPKFGDKQAWAPRLALGVDTLYKVALGGKGGMPAKGGNTALSDAEVKAGVDYMAAAAR